MSCLRWDEAESYSKEAQGDGADKFQKRDRFGSHLDGDGPAIAFDAD
jgi:hypothetical protein